MLQLSIFLENSIGRLAAVLEVLKELNVNIRALSLAETKDFGVLRIMVADPEKVAEQLKLREIVATTTPVWVLKVPDRSGGLSDIMSDLVKQGVVVEYMYAFVEKADEEAQVVLHVLDEKVMKKAVDILGIKVN
ncbi:amino acid-binding protein [Dehalobacter sp. DCM]|uniref:ACT domain-containing protein n=1 Tax=Dehalobacter sp. DCM TaxID=2907827 RepID=UPI003081844A|nr:amino acid-binding protein [Dehalobacter sp. DCM]